MDKAIIDNIRFKVEEKDQERFLSLINEFNDKLKKMNLMPHVALFKDIDKEKTLFTLFLYFQSDKAFDEWEAKFPKEFIEETTKTFKEFMVGYNYLEQVI